MVLSARGDSSVEGLRYSCFIEPKMILQKFLASLWTCLNAFETSNISKLAKGPRTGTLKVLDGQICTLQEELREQMRSDAVEACQMPPPAQFCSNSTLLVLEPDICVISEFMGHCKECQLWTSAADHQLRSNPQPMLQVNGQCGGWRFFFQTKTETVALWFQTTWCCFNMFQLWNQSSGAWRKQFFVYETRTVPRSDLLRKVGLWTPKMQQLTCRSFGFEVDS